MNKDEVFSGSLNYFNGDELAAKVWTDKYALKDNQKNYYEVSPDNMHKRLAREFARIEKNYQNPISEDEIYFLLKNFKYLVPQGSPMYGIGNNFALTSLSNCFVIGNNNYADSYGGIMRADEEQVQLMKRRGGVGQDISHIRPGGAFANNSILGELAGTAIYMERYSNSTREVAQGGRRGALMLSISIKHPDSERFIDAKLEQGKVTGANISVKVYDDFMQAVQNDEDYWQTFPIDADISGYTDRSRHEYGVMEDHLFYDEEGNEKLVYIKRIKARELWGKIIKNAHKSAEPGVLFWDKVREESPADYYGENWKTVSTNPCGEIPLCPYDSCRLLAINLFSYVENPFTPEAKFNWKLFKEHVEKAQRIMDDLVDLEIEKINQILNKIETDPETEDIKRVEKTLWTRIRDKAIQGRRTGLGITAEGDMLAALGHTYGSSDAIRFSEEVHKCLAVEAYKTTIKLAEERGAFPIWNYETEEVNPFINRIVEQLKLTEEGKAFLEKYKQTGRRNISLLTIAPTGTTSLMTQTTSGIEPVFMPVYKRRRKTEDKTKAVFVDEVGDYWEEYRVFHPKFIDWWIVASQYEHNPEKAKEILQECSEEDMEEIVKESPYYKATSNDIDWKASVNLQGSVQKWIDHSISKTINLPKETSVETVGELYMEAWKSGCKGVTVYRDGSRSGVLLTDKKENTSPKKFQPIDAIKRPTEVVADIYYPTIQGERYIVLVGILDGHPYEVFAFKLNNVDISRNLKQVIVKKRKSSWYDLVDIKTRETLVEDLSHVFETPDEEDKTRLISGWLRTGGNIKYVVDILNKSKGDLTTFSKVIARQLKRYIRDGEKSSEKCPECGDNLVFEEGCLNCKSCGFGKCG